MKTLFLLFVMAITANASESTVQVTSKREVNRVTSSLELPRGHGVLAYTSINGEDAVIVTIWLPESFPTHTTKVSIFGELREGKTDPLMLNVSTGWSFETTQEYVLIGTNNLYAGFDYPMDTISSYTLFPAEESTYQDLYLGSITKVTKMHISFKDQVPQKWDFILELFNDYAMLEQRTKSISATESIVIPKALKK